jgi:signal transduction histidine kinase
MTEKLESDPLWVFLQGEILREIAHDLRGRAMALRGFAELQALAESDREAPGIRLPLSEVAELEALARDLETVNATLEPEEAELTSLSEEVERAVGVLKRLGDQRMARIAIDPPVGDPRAVRVPQTSLRCLIMVVMAGVGGGAKDRREGDVRVRVEEWEGGGRIVLRSSARGGEGLSPPRELLARTGTAWKLRSGENGLELELLISG